MLLSRLVTLGAEPEASPDDLPRLPPTPLESAIETFEIKPGFALELAAHEPLVEDPIDAAFDEDGRLFVVEMRGYSEQRESKRGRIRLLHDDNDDGIFDRATNYVTGLRWPTSVACFDGGVFIAETPDILYCKDSDGDGEADTREVVFTGFGLGRDRLNVQALVNGLQWGPDNRIWGATSMNGGHVSRPGQEPINLTGSDFSFDPRQRDLRAENGTAQNGMSFDTHGRRYVSSNSLPLIAVMWERQWVTANPYHSLPTPLESIVRNDDSIPVFRLSADEPWRIVRTRWRVAGVVGGPVEGGGRVSGYFTGASGVTLYTGDAFGPDFINNAFIGDVGSNLVHRRIIQPRRPNGLALHSERADDKETREFLASRDNWFRPTNFTNGPDGCLYIIDMCREVIEHPWSLPDGIKKHLDLNSGTDRGRIYRVKPAAFQRRPTLALRDLSNDALADLRTHPNGWHRMTAQRLLWERGDPRAGDGWGEPSLRSSLVPKSSQELSEWLKSDDPWQQAAALHALRDPEEAARLIDQLPEATQLSLATFVGRTNSAKAAGMVIASADAKPQRHAFQLLTALAEGLPNATTTKPLDRSYRIAREAITSAKTSEDSQIAAAALLAHCQEIETENVLISALESTTSTLLQRQIITSLVARTSDRFLREITDTWAQRPANVTEGALSAFLTRPSRRLILLNAIRENKIDRSELSPYQIDTLRADTTPEVRSGMAALYPVEARPSPADRFADYASALTSPGDAHNGRTIYQQRCLTCHRAMNEGHAVGPDITTFRAAGRGSLLTNILDPNREVAPRYQAYSLTLDTEEILVGIIANESPTELTLRQPAGLQTTITRKQVARMQSLGTSLMPEGLEAGLSIQDMADLLEFLETNPQ